VWKRLNTEVKHVIKFEKRRIWEKYGGPAERLQRKQETFICRNKEYDETKI
jgi:hypothetical protein